MFLKLEWNTEHHFYHQQLGIILLSSKSGGKVMHNLSNRLLERIIYICMVESFFK